MPRIIEMHSIKAREAKDIVRRIKKGEIFIYPTDTIYGLGCNAMNDEAVRKIREIKQRTDKPFSVIAPSKLWLVKNFHVKKAYVEKLPGPFTYILKPKAEGIISKEVSRYGTVGIRIPDHPFVKLVQKAKVPFVTTSVNLSGDAPAVDVKKISPQITEKVDVIIDDGILDNKPSTVLDLTGQIAKILRK